jgi:hypothetical protein
MFERRTARINLAKSIDIVSAYYKRMGKFMDDNFEYQQKPRDVFSRYSSPSTSFNRNERSPETHIIVVTEKNLNEFLRLKKEFEAEFNAAQRYADVLKPQFFDDGAAAYDAKLKMDLQSSAWAYSIILEVINKYEIYTKKQ